MGSSSAIRSRKVLVMRLLPMPASPHNNTAWPSPSRGSSQQAFDEADLLVPGERKVSGYVGCIASNRLSAVRVLITR